MAQRKHELVCETVGGEPYEYYPLGEYVVIAPGVCGSEPTFKYTRINVEHALGRLAMGGRWSRWRNRPGCRSPRYRRRSTSLLRRSSARPHD
jgi:hypothetical protein